MDEEFLALLKSAAAGLGYRLKRNADVIGVRWPFAMVPKRTGNTQVFSTLDNVSRFIQAEAKCRAKLAPPRAALTDRARGTAPHVVELRKGGMQWEIGQP